MNKDDVLSRSWNAAQLLDDPTRNLPLFWTSMTRRFLTIHSMKQLTWVTSQLCSISGRSRRRLLRLKAHCEYFRKPASCRWPFSSLADDRRPLGRQPSEIFKPKDSLVGLDWCCNLWRTRAGLFPSSSHWRASTLPTKGIASS